MKNLAPLILLVSSIIQIAIAAPDVPMPPAADIHQTLAAIQRKYDMVGMSVAGLDRGRIVWEASLGLADIERQVPVTAETHFRIASISKTVTTVALLQLWEQGKFKLDDPIGMHLGYAVANPHHPGQPITFRHLLTHTASFADGVPYDDFLLLTYNDPAHAPSLRELLCHGGKHYQGGAVYSTNAPGAVYAYSNLGYGLVGTLVERLSGERFDEYAARHVLEPLGMKARYNPARLRPGTPMAVLYQHEKNAWQAKCDHYRGAAPTNRIGAGYKIGWNALPCAPQGGLRASIRDLGKYTEFLAGRRRGRAARVLKPATLDLMLGRDARGTGALPTLTFARTTQFMPGEKWIGHTGSAYGLYSLLFLQEDGPQGILLLTNGSKPGEDVDGFSPMEREIAQAVCAHLRAIKKR